MPLLFGELLWKYNNNKYLFSKQLQWYKQFESNDDNFSSRIKLCHRYQRPPPYTLGAQGSKHK